MSSEHHLPVGQLLIFLCVIILVSQASQELSFNAGKEIITSTAPALFACKKISFPNPFYGGQQGKVFASVGHTVKSLTSRNGAAIWVEDVTANGFTVCIVEYAEGSNGTTEVNWMALHSAPSGSQIGTSSLDAWTSGTECKKIAFKESFKTAPTMFVTALHQFPKRPQDAMAIWIEDLHKDSFKICLRETKIFDGTHENIKINWMAITDLRLENFSLTNKTVFNDTSSGAYPDNHALCQTINFTGLFYAPPVVLVTPKYRYNNNFSFSSQCNAVVTWVEYTSTTDTKVCVKNYNSDGKKKGTITVDYIVIGGFPFQRGRRHMPQIPSLGYSHCEVIAFKPDVFYPDKPIEVQVTINHIDTTNKSYVHDAAVSWVENVNYTRFTACVMAAGYNERKSHANVTVDWMAYQGAPVGGVTGKVRISQWWTGTTCKAVNFPYGKFRVKPSVFVTAEHHHPGLKRDAASLWIEDVTQRSCKVCLRELQNYAGSHQDISVNWWAFTHLHNPPFLEHNSIYFVNNKPPPGDHNNAFCKDVNFANFYNGTPNVFVSADHSSKEGNLSPIHNAITAWVEYINKTGFRVCFKELFDAKYDPLFITYTVLPDGCSTNGNGRKCYEPFSAVFTNLGASGRYGPTTVGSHYTGQDHDGQVTLSSGIQQWTVPHTGVYRIEAIGAAGGYGTHSNNGQYRGRGARMIGTFSLARGEILRILVGQEGGINRADYAAGGGGGTFVVRGSNTPLIAAGGGGGIEQARSRHAGCDASTGTTGNPGYRSWSGGNNGHGANTADNGNSGGGGGGFYSSGRSSRTFGGTMGNGGEGGKGFLQGGVGGRALGNNAVGGFGGGGGAYGIGGGGGAGGGGGYSGGSSGDNEFDSCGGGGGSYNAGINQQNECCYKTAGHGQVTITLL